MSKRWQLLAVLAISIPLITHCQSAPPQQAPPEERPPEAPVPSKADIAKIYNITPVRNQAIDVRYFRKDECSKDEWCRINGAGEYLKANDWLLTGQVSRADLALMYNQTEYRPVLFWQEEGSRSRFKPQEGSCHFTTDIGKFLYAHPHTSADPGCEKITSTHAVIFPNGTVLFVVGDENDTRVGVLSSGSKNPVVQNRKSGKRVTLKEGEFGEVFADGRIEKGEFSLADFYDEQTLALGLGPADKDIAYVRSQEPGIREILEEIRKETLAALDGQNDRGPRDIDLIDPPDPGSTPRPIIPGPTDLGQGPPEPPPPPPGPPDGDGRN